MRLIEFGTARDPRDKIYINPDMIRYIIDDDCNAGCSKITFESGSAYVHCTAQEAAEKIEKETNPIYCNTTYSEAHS